jgi:hypothetical protein
MTRWIIVPYDRSAVARAVLRHAARLYVETPGEAPYAGVLLATAGFDPTELCEVVQEATHITGPAVPLEVRLLDAGDPIGALQRLAAPLPDAVFVAPLGLHGIAGRAPWYAEACRQGGIDHTLVLFNIMPKEIAEVQEGSPDGHRVEGRFTALIHAAARLRPGGRAPLRGGVA